jgi:uncharacterized protein YycO
MRIGLYKGHSLLNKLVRFFSRGEYNHAALIFDDDSCIEADPFKGVYFHKKYYDDIDQKNYIIKIYEIKQTPKQSKTIESFAKDQVGKKYDFRAFLGFLFYTTKETRKERGKWTCSELVFASFQKAHINLLNQVSAWKVSPSMIGFSPKLILQETSIISNEKIKKIV